MTTIPGPRLRSLNEAPLRENGAFVLYWMIAYRRTTYNFSLQHAVGLAQTLRKPLIVLEAVRSDYPWASDRFHRFMLDGMADNASAFDGTDVVYYPYVEPARGAGKGLLEALAGHACAVVTDDFPCFFLPRMIEAVAPRLAVRFEAIDSNGLIPIRSSGIAFSTAHAFRRFVQKHAREHLEAGPRANPLKDARLTRLRNLPAFITERWPRAGSRLLRGDPAALAGLPIDHTVPALKITGGSAAARTQWRRFLEDRLAAYPSDRNQPGKHGTSGLSPYLHFGHIASHEVFATLMKAERWTARKLATTHAGTRSGWWGVSPAADAFLDQLVVWRELGFNMCGLRHDYDRYESLPAWARDTLEQHAADRRAVVYDLAALEHGGTHDPLWNAAQGQLVRDGWFHNYMRMLWGKKILEWSVHPRDALRAMMELMNKYSLDGRDPNSYSGCFWTLGRYDRPWPERPIFGKVRYMSSKNTARKMSVTGYIDEYAAAAREPRPAG